MSTVPASSVLLKKFTNPEVWLGVCWADAAAAAATVCG
jgi:hypothetical protein